MPGALRAGVQPPSPLIAATRGVVGTASRWIAADQCPPPHGTHPRPARPPRAYRRTRPLCPGLGKPSPSHYRSLARLAALLRLYTTHPTARAVQLAPLVKRPLNTQRMPPSDAARCPLDARHALAARAHAAAPLATHMPRASRRAARFPPPPSSCLPFALPASLLPAAHHRTPRAPARNTPLRRPAFCFFVLSVRQKKCLLPAARGGDDTCVRSALRYTAHTARAICTARHAHTHTAFAAPPTPTPASAPHSRNFSPDRANGPPEVQALRASAFSLSQHVGLLWRGGRRAQGQSLAPDGPASDFGYKGVPGSRLRPGGLLKRMHVERFLAVSMYLPMHTSTEALFDVDDDAGMFTISFSSVLDLACLPLISYRQRQVVPRSRVPPSPSSSPAHAGSSPVSHGVHGQRLPPWPVLKGSPNIGGGFAQASGTHIRVNKQLGFIHKVAAYRASARVRRLAWPHGQQRHAGVVLRAQAHGLGAQLAQRAERDGRGDTESTPPSARSSVGMAWPVMRAGGLDGGTHVGVSVRAVVGRWGAGFCAHGRWFGRRAWAGCGDSAGNVHTRSHSFTPKPSRLSTGEQEAPSEREKDFKSHTQALVAHPLAAWLADALCAALERGVNLWTDNTLFIEGPQFLTCVDSRSRGLPPQCRRNTSAAVSVPPHNPPRTRRRGSGRLRACGALPDIDVRARTPRWARITSSRLAHSPTSTFLFTSLTLALLSFKVIGAFNFAAGPFLFGTSLAKRTFPSLSTTREDRPYCSPGVNSWYLRLPWVVRRSGVHMRLDRPAFHARAAPRLKHRLWPCPRILRAQVPAAVPVSVPASLLHGGAHGI
ncbi:hypothetical protein GGX14DRAFT_578441 [Mycena pura]|uniref:Uncharacterized protein n=1 Tax=Mycena pura TaxID=153505 RepID=A0AAD6UU42_9AGAR|nr:hypothetical protein GGX14DRAFT_578441 [Mycena pura]